MTWFYWTIVIAIVNVCSASTEFESDLSEKVRVRRQYYVCPPDFKRISNNCYYFSQHMATWQDAHYDCRDRYSDLAILQTAAEDKKLRGQLNKPSMNPREWWIGGIYDWERMQWNWGSSGKKLEYHGFSRMSPESKDKLKWHCIILDPTMKYKWSARSCVLGKYYICQKKVARVNKRGLEKLRKKYNNTLNEIPAPIYEKPVKPRKQENWSNGNSQTGLKQHRPNISKHANNAFGHQKNTTEIRRGRKRKNRDNPKNRDNLKNREAKNRDNPKNNQKNREMRRNRRKQQKDLELYMRNGTSYISAEERKNRKRNRRNKSKENNSLENLIRDEPKIKVWHTETNSVDDVTQKTTLLTNTISPLHPRLIIEEHDFLDLNEN